MTTSADNPLDGIFKAADRGGQPTPVHQPGSPSMHDLLIDTIKMRKALGLSRYGTILQAGNGRDALQDALDEAIDLCVYLRQEIAERASRVLNTDDGLRAEMPMAFEYLHLAFNLPADVHIIGAHVEDGDNGRQGNLVLELEAFAHHTFPGTRVTAAFNRKWNVATGEMDTVFVEWEEV